MSLVFKGNQQEPPFGGHPKRKRHAAHPSLRGPIWPNLVFSGFCRAHLQVREGKITIPLDSLSPVPFCVNPSPYASICSSLPEKTNNHISSDRSPLTPTGENIKVFLIKCFRRFQGLRPGARRPKSGPRRGPGRSRARGSSSPAPSDGKLRSEFVSDMETRLEVEPQQKIFSFLPGWKIKGTPKKQKNSKKGR